MIPQPGSFVLITDSINVKKPKWTLGKVVENIFGKDKIRVKCGSGYTVDRPLQLVRNLKISSSTDTKQSDNASYAFPIQSKITTLQNGHTTISNPKLLNQCHRQAKTNAIDRMTGLALNGLEEE